MNNGVNNINTNNLGNNTPELKPMAGVTISPAVDGPIDASKKVENNTTPTIVQNNTVQQYSQPQQVNIQPMNNVQTPINTIPNATNNINLGMQAAPIPATTTPNYIPQQPQIQSQAQPQPIVQVPNNKSQKAKNTSLPIIILLLLLLGFSIYYLTTNNNKMISELKYNCTPITASKEEIKLDINSTLVQSLYSKFASSIREDIAQPYFNDEWKLYMAYRQILETDKYDSNCNLFNQTAMEPYRCQVNNYFTPKAFKEETILQKMKELYGENISIPLNNIQLGNSCVIGYQYIKERGEFVEGQCSQKEATSFKVEKKLTEATSTRNTIILTEEVKYIEAEGLTLPSYLISGIYHYTFRLDLNYNYVLINKSFEPKY